MCCPNFPIRIIQPIDNVDDEADANPESDYDCESDFEPPYTPTELVAIITGFYTFLTTLHFSADDLKLPPASGWPSIPSLCAFKSERAMEVLHQLPYFKDTTPAQLHYKSTVIDYTSLPSSFYDAERDDYIDEDDEFHDYEGRLVDRRNLICFAQGRESGGRQLYLDVLTGEVTEDIIRCDLLSPVDVVAYFEALKEEYRSLRLVPCTGREIIEAQKVDEGGDVGREEVLAEKGDFGTDTDVCWVRSVYRRHGWPDAFQQEDADKEINEVMEEMDVGERGKGKDLFWWRWRGC
ncbi:hypothetical protein O988_03255 [Pseudogymnoascus sp. VKM F-3808]|nr:hypothetical protein O988_03255 [Pseudogymnoascus sp. VKM F-3808]